MTAYMGEDLGAIGSEEGLRGLERVENAKRADHVMEMRGRYVDGRHANAGAQYINSGGKRNNARFAHTGAVRDRPTIRLPALSAKIPSLVCLGGRMIFKLR